MKSKKNSRSGVRKQNIPLRRRLIIIYSRLLLSLKLLLAFIIFLFFFTTKLDFIKSNVRQYFNEKTAIFGFKVKEVLIEGQKNVPSQEILDALATEQGAPLFAVNLGLVKARLEGNSWIKAALVERQLPDTIYINILERVPIAIWQVKNQLFLIDDEGVKITSKSIDHFSNLMHVVGPDANIYAQQLIHDLSKYPELSNKVISAIRYGDRRWNLNLEQGILIKLPDSGVKHALAYIAKLHSKQKLFDQDYKMLDLRSHDKYYIEKY